MRPLPAWSGYVDSEDSMDPDDTDRTDPDRETKVRCTVCGESVQTTKWHPAATTITADGRVEILAFCSQRCRDQWENDGTG